MKKKYRLKPEVKQWLIKAIVSLLLVYMVIGMLCLAVESHSNPERHEYCVINEVC